MIASRQVSGLYIPIYRPNPQLFLMSSAQEPIKRVIRRTRLLGPTIQSHHGRVRERNRRGSDDTPFPRSLTPHRQFKPNTSSLIRTPVNLRGKHGRRSDDQKSTDFPPKAVTYDFVRFTPIRLSDSRTNPIPAFVPIEIEPSWTRRSFYGNRLVGQ